MDQNSLQTVIWKQMPRTGSMNKDVISTKPVKQVRATFRLMSERFDDYVEKGFKSMPQNSLFLFSAYF